MSAGNATKKPSMSIDTAVDAFPSCALIIISQDHYAPMVVSGKGSYTLTKEKNGTRYVMTAARTLTKRIG